MRNLSLDELAIYGAGVTAERERWRAVVDAAIAKHCDFDRKTLPTYMLKRERRISASERVLLEILEAQEQKA